MYALACERFQINVDSACFECYVVCWFQINRTDADEITAPEVKIFKFQAITLLNSPNQYLFNGPSASSRVQFLEKLQEPNQTLTALLCERAHHGGPWLRRLILYYYWSRRISLSPGRKQQAMRLRRRYRGCI